MPKKNQIDEWINQLMDGELAPEQRKALEERLLTDPHIETLSSWDRAQLINRFMKEIANDTPKFQEPDFMWSKVKALILEENVKSTNRWKRLIHPFIFPRWAWASLLAASLVFCCIGFFRIHENRSFGKIWQLYSFKPDVEVTSYESKSGKATIIWLSGLDERSSQFGQIWQVYSFKPEITATAYNSQSGDATIIWLSGMDDDFDTSS